MKLDYAHTYAATPEQVVALMRTPEFLDDVAKHAGAVAHTVNISDDATRLGMTLQVPSSLIKFVGQTVQIDQIFRFQGAAADGTIPGTVEVEVPGMPVEVSATARLRPEGETTRGLYTGELRVRIPLVGKKVEAQVEPYITDAFDGLERRAADWLSRAN